MQHRLPPEQLPAYDITAENVIALKTLQSKPVQNSTTPTCSAINRIERGESVNNINTMVLSLEPELLVQTNRVGIDCM